jgi:AAA domain
VTGRPQVVTAEWYDTMRADLRLLRIDCEDAVAQLVHGKATAAAVDDKASLLLALTPLSDVGMRSIRFARRPQWQWAAFHLLAARKGTGKGTYLAWLAAAMTRGQLDGGPRNVIYVAASEDSLEIDVKPRLVAAGAVVERVDVIEQHITLPDDIDTIRSLAEGRGNVGMLVIDPLANHVGRRKTNDDGEVRDAISRLNRLADDLDVLLVGTRNVTVKKAESGALAAILGSSAWVDVPRAVLVIAQDDEDESIRHIQVVAGNRAPGSCGERFRIEPATVPGLGEPVTRAVPLGASTKDVDDLLSGSATGDESKSDMARELILDIIEDEGEKESDALDERVARETGLAERTVRNLRNDLRQLGLVKSHPDKDESRAIVRWMVYRTSKERP